MCQILSQFVSATVVVSHGLLCQSHILFIMIVFIYFRQQQHYVSLSFDSIAGVGSNGAIVHYKPGLPFTLSTN